MNAARLVVLVLALVSVVAGPAAAFDGIVGVYYSPDGSALAVGQGREVRVLDAATGATRAAAATLGGSTGELAYACAIAPDGSIAAGTREGRLVRFAAGAR